MRTLILPLLFLALAAPAGASDWADATPTAWHQLARAESLLSAPEPPEPVAVCVVDSGVNLTPDLAPAVIERLAYDGGDPGDTYPQEGIDDGHGTYVATFLAGQVNGWGGAGLWPRAKIVSVRVFPPGGVRAKAGDYLDGMRACLKRPEVRVMNLSLGDIDATSEEMAAIADRVAEYRQQKDINIVAAAGNRGGAVEAPARFGSVFAVGAVRSTGGLCQFSAQGDELDIIAPGCDLDGADQRGHRSLFDGTSFAAPMVAAALAALRSYAGLDADQAESLLLRTGRASNAGLVLDVEAALTAVGVDWRKSTPRPTTNESALGPSAPNTRIFLEYPRPKLSISRLHRSKAYVRVRVNNLPASAAIEGRSRGRSFEQSSTRLRLRRGTRLDLRFISDEGFSDWTRLRWPRKGSSQQLP